MKKNDERYERVIDLYLEGESIVNINKITGVSRPTIYKLLEDDEYKAVIDKRLQEIRTQGQNRLQNKLNTYVNELENIALTSENENTRKDCLVYLINRILGTPTNKTQDVTENKEQTTINDNDLDYMIDEIDNEISEDNVINLESKKLNNN
ncbi:helix-turn-helix domain-containing protein [Clostridium beijerinckii]|uniref:helix-turn-helix domain-containing protein n=1 Tax=Clostridium beijerinckii TaxID=1520 RepID=UPI00098BE25A|nr:helix-turn-helix domain-containing protein [Clostridium beijerinckii]NRT78128.1 hypothetical protein [Clostridium beijerinckii]OOM44792.1 helix-turn-helix domain of resolvase [Clostridium beijerinckii]